MKKCSEKEHECYTICDFCKYYDFNGDKEGRYTGNGYCALHDNNRDPDDGCEEFHCFTCK